MKERWEGGRVTATTGELGVVLAARSVQTELGHVGRLYHQVDTCRDGGEVWIL